MQENNCIATFCDAIPTKPYATDDFNFGVRILPKQVALRKSFIQPSHAYYQHSLIFDIDKPAAIVDLHYSMYGIPLPNFVTENPENGHGHFVYMLETPIYKTDASRIKPIQYAAAIERTLRFLLDADVCYSGLMTKNPMSDRWRLHVLRQESYTLNELAALLELNAHQVKKPPLLDEAAGLGRNCYLFHHVRVWAYVEIRKFRGNVYQAWLDHVIAYCKAQNELFEPSMPYNEVKGVAKSIARFCWKNDAYCYQEFIDRQTRKGKLGAKAALLAGAQSKGGQARSDRFNEKRKQALELRKQGLSYGKISIQLNITKATIIKWCKSV